METLTHGFKKPEDGDIGAEVFTALEENIQQVNDHTHNGVNSAKVSSTSLDKETHSIEAANWAVSGNRYRQVVVLTGTLLFDETMIFVRTSTGEPAYPEIEKVSANSFYIFSNDNTVAFTLYYF